MLKGTWLLTERRLGAALRATRSTLLPTQPRGTSEAHQAALRRIEHAGGKMISLMQLICELQRDWARKETVAALVKVASEIPSTFAIQLAYDHDKGD